MGPERKIQVKVTDYAKKKYHALCKKIEAGRFGANGWPDYLILGAQGQHFFIEFKGPGGKLTKLQALRHEEILSHAHPCFVVGSVEEGIRLVDRMLE